MLPIIWLAVVPPAITEGVGEPALVLIPLPEEAQTQAVWAARAIVLAVLVVRMLEEMVGRTELLEEEEQARLPVAPVALLVIMAAAAAAAVMAAAAGVLEEVLCILLVPAALVEVAERMDQLGIPELAVSLQEMEGLAH